MYDRDELEEFLDNFEPDDKLRHATLDPYLNDPVARMRMLRDSSCEAPLVRLGGTNVIKIMDDQEERARAFQFFEDNHAKWSGEFRDYVLSRNVSAEKLDKFIESFATLWVDGRKTRQLSPEMLSIKASIRDLDILCYPKAADRFVINELDGDVPALFTPREMAVIFTANSGLIDGLLPDYLDALGDEGPGSLDTVYVRRGVFMEHPGGFRRELHYLSSFSLSLGPVEQFAHTGARSKKTDCVPSIFSAPVSAIQDRIVAFAPFIEGMPLSQLEFVVAPPLEKTPLLDLGRHGGIHEFCFE